MKKNNNIKLTESQLKKVIGNSIKKVLKEWAEPEEGKYYPGKYIYYPEDGSLAGDMGYEINDIAELVSNSPSELLKSIKEYFEYDYPTWEDEHDPEAPVILFVTQDTETAYNGVYYISSLDKQYLSDIQSKIGNGAKVVVINALTNESKLNKVIAESVKKVLKEWDEDSDSYYGGGLPDKYFEDEAPQQYNDEEEYSEKVFIVFEKNCQVNSVCKSKKTAIQKADECYGFFEQWTLLD